MLTDDGGVVNLFGAILTGLQSALHSFNGHYDAAMTAPQLLHWRICFFMIRSQPSRPPTMQMTATAIPMALANVSESDARLNAVTREIAAPSTEGIKRR